MQKIFAIIAMLLLSVQVAACESAEERASRENSERLRARFAVEFKNELPPDWQALVKKAISAKLKDPDSAQFKFEGKPVKGNVGHGEKWMTTVEVNAKNSFGGYTGYKTWAIAIKNGEVDFAEPSSGDAEARDTWRR